MSRTFLIIFTWVITRLFYWMSGFNPMRDLPAVLGYSLDLGIWLLASYIIDWSLRALGIGRKPR